MWKSSILASSLLRKTTGFIWCSKKCLDISNARGVYTSDCWWKSYFPESTMNQNFPKWRFKCLKPIAIMRLLLFTEADISDGLIKNSVSCVVPFQKLNYCQIQLTILVKNLSPPKVTSLVKIIEKGRSWDVKDIVACW